jgi:tetratricopeptide (TPR) repeat protein
MDEGTRKINEGILATREEDYLTGLTLFLDVYGTEEQPPISGARAAEGLSYFGLCLALVSKKFKTAIDLCRRAVDLQFYNGDHYANLTKVYVAAGNRKKAVEAAEAGLKLLPDHEGLVEARASLGVRARPAVPILDRGNPINVSLGQARHAKKAAEEGKVRRVRRVKSEE